MALERLTQITEVGIQSGITLRNVNVEGAYVSGVVTATNLNITGGGANFSGVVTASSFSGNVTGNITPTGLVVTGVSTFQASSFWGDGDVAYFGDGQDLLIWHNSTDSIIRDNGTGDLLIEGGNRIKMTNPTGIETYAVFNQDGAVELWFDNSKKLETTGAGIIVTGVATATSGLVVSAGNVGIGTANPSQKLEVVGGEIKAGRIDSNEEGGQVSFGRATDNATGWYIDVYGSTSTPSLRFVDVSNAAVRATIDGSGRVTKPYQPFVAGGAGSASVSGNNNHVWAKSGYVWSNVGNHWNATTGTFTAPVDGVYQVTAAIRYSGVPVTPSYVYIYFLASYQSASGQPILLWSPGTESGGTYRPRILTAAMYMRANDTLQPRLYVTNGTITLDEGVTSQSDSFLNIYLLG